MNRKTYLLHENAHERLRSIPMIQPPQSLDGPLRDLFKSQEEERYKLRMKHLVEKEKLVLAVEQVCSIGLHLPTSRSTDRRYKLLRFTLKIFCTKPPKPLNQYDICALFLKVGTTTLVELFIY